METIYYAILFLFLLAVLAITCLININELDKRIDEILAEEKRQNKRIDILEKHEQVHQAEEARYTACVDAKDLFKEW